MNNARRGIAPCGHPGRYVIGCYIECDVKCDQDSIPIVIEPEKTKRLCKHCGSTDTQKYPGGSVDGRSVFHCYACMRGFIAD